ncbi:hypothetical protein ACVILK_005325 [Bradyrhizobium embrapense]
MTPSPVAEGKLSFQLPTFDSDLSEARRTKS